MSVVGLSVVALAVTSVGWLAWRYRHRKPESGTRREGVAAEPSGTATSSAERLAEAGHSAGLAGAVGGMSLSVGGVSLSGWPAFRVLSVVALDETAIVAFRVADEARKSTWIRRRGHGVAAPSRPSRLTTTDQTLVLLIGGDAPAAEAQDLLERWRRTSAVLSAHPSPVAGRVDFVDRQGSALSAVLLAA